MIFMEYARLAKSRGFQYAYDNCLNSQTSVCSKKFRKAGFYALRRVSTHATATTFTVSVTVATKKNVAPDRFHDVGVRRFDGHDDGDVVAVACVETHTITCYQSESSDR